MEEADIGGHIDDRLTVEFHQQAQDTVGAGVLRPHAEQHVLFGVDDFHSRADLGAEFLDAEFLNAVACLRY